MARQFVIVAALVVFFLVGMASAADPAPAAEAPKSVGAAAGDAVAAAGPAVGEAAAAAAGAASSLVGTPAEAPGGASGAASLEFSVIAAAAVVGSAALFY